MKKKSPEKNRDAFKDIRCYDAACGGDFTFLVNSFSINKIFIQQLAEQGLFAVGRESNGKRKCLTCQ